jgi:hypothetical protein
MRPKMKLVIYGAKPQDSMISPTIWRIMRMSTQGMRFAQYKFFRILGVETLNSTQSQSSDSHLDFYTMQFSLQITY